MGYMILEVRFNQYTKRIVLGRFGWIVSLFISSVSMFAVLSYLLTTPRWFIVPKSFKFQVPGKMLGERIKMRTSSLYRVVWNHAYHPSSLASVGM